MRCIYLFLCLAPFTLTAQLTQQDLQRQCLQEGRQLGYQREATRSDGTRVYFYGCRPLTHEEHKVKRWENIYLHASNDPRRALAEKTLNDMYILVHVSDVKTTPPQQSTPPAASSTLRRVETPLPRYTRSDGVLVEFQRPTRNLTSAEQQDLLLTKNLYLKARSEPWSHRWTQNGENYQYNYLSRDDYESQLRSKYGVEVKVIH